MRMMKIAVIEDDKKYANNISQFVRRYSSEHDIELESNWFSDGLTFISDYAPIYDIIFMDIDMPHLNGMETAKKLRALGDAAPLIFITNMAQFAVSGYEVDAIGFLVKPVEYFAFSLTLDKALNLVKRKLADYLHFVVRDMAVKVYIRDIKYAEVAKHKIIYHTFHGDIEVPGTMTDTMEKLKDYDFALCNSCWLVNLHHVSKIKGDTVIVGGEELHISRGKKQEFVRKLTAYFARGG